MSAIKEFQLRSKDETEVLILFSSNLWDVYRFQDESHRLENTDRWLLEYRLDYSALVINIISNLRKNVDSLILQTTPYVKVGHYRGPSTLLNDEIIKIAAFFQLPVFETRKFIEDNDLHLAPQDDRHQKNEISMLYAKQIGSKNWTYENANICTGKDRNYLPNTPISIYGSKSYYMIKEDKKKHWIPDWDTFNHLGIKLSNVVIVTEKQFNAIDEGEAIPPCQC